MARTFKTWWALGATLVLAACGQLDTDESQPLGVTQAAIANSCRPTQPAELQPGAPTGIDLVCTGPWEYRPECYKLASTSACQQDGWHMKTCTGVPNTCNYSIRADQTYDGTAKGVKSSLRDCDYERKPPCITTTSSNYVWTCQDEANRIMGELRSQNKEDPKYPLYAKTAYVDGSRVYGSTYSDYTGTRTYWTESCNIVIANVVTEWRYGQNLECGTHDEPCPDYSNPKYEYCRDPSHGIEDDPDACYGEPGYELRYSEPGISQRTLKERDPSADIRTGSYPNRPRCMTADDTPYADVEAKYTRLVDQLESLATLVPGGVDGPNLKRQLVNALKLLFELHGDSPALSSSDRAGGHATRRDRIIALYTTHPETNSVRRIDPGIDFDFGAEGPAPSIAPDKFSVRWTGYVQALEPGTYTFHAQTDDGFRLWVNDQLLIDRWYPQVVTWHQASISLPVGRHALKVEFFEDGGTAVARLLWAPPGTSGPQAIPLAQLTDPNQAHNGLLGEYFDNMDLTSDSCGTWQSPLVGGTCSGLEQFEATMAMCHRLTQPHVSGAAVNYLLDECTNAAADIAALSAAWCSDPSLWPAYDQVTVQLLVKGLPHMTTTLTSADRVGELHERLAAIQRWYAAARANVYPGSVPSPELMANVSGVMKAFWTGAWLKDELSASVTTDAEAEALRAKVLSDGLLADRQVLRAAFGEMGSPPLTGAPLLYLVSDALRGLDERLLEASGLHDLACRFKTCTGVQTTTSQLWDLLASLNDEAALSTRLSSASKVGADWRGVFEQMKLGHGAMRSAVEDALGLPAGSYTSNVLFERALDSLPDSAASLTAMLREAKARSTGYAHNGLFALTDTRVLKVGLNKDKQQNITDQLEHVIQQLDSSVQAYKTSRLSLVQGLVDQLKNQSTETNLGSRFQALHERLVDLNRDLNGLRLSHAVDAARYGDFMDGFAELFPAIQTSGQDVLKFEHELTVPNRGRRDAAAPEDVAGMAALDAQSNPFKLSPQTGDQLVIQVSGEWSPTCALGLTRAPNGVTVQTSTTAGPIMTGPEGFSVVESSGSYRARANQTVTSHNEFATSKDTEQWCGGFGIQIPFGDYASFTENVTKCMNDEAGISWSKTFSETTSAGTEKKSTFSVSRGLRSPLAPFPNEPVGSLLLVETVRGETARQSIRSVRVLQSPSSSVLVSADSDYYLVVNDLNNARCTWTGNSSLVVRVQHLEPASAYAMQVLSSMVDALNAMQPAAQAYVAQGRLLPSQAALLRTTAYQQIYNTCGCTELSSFPKSLVSLFDMWVEKAIVGIEREVELVNIERQLRTLMLELRALGAELNNAQLQSRLLALAPAWALRDLDGAELRGYLQDLDKVMSEWVAPMVHLLRPNTMVGLTSTEQADLDALTAIDPTSSSTDISVLADAAKKAARLVNKRLTTQNVEAPTPTISEVFLSIPRKDKPRVTTWAAVDEPTAEAVWNEIRAGGNPVLTLKPEHIYRPQGGQALLTCNLSTPIINSMVLYAILPAGSTSNPYTIPVTLTPEMSFPTSSQLFRYDFANANYLGPAVQMLFGPASTLQDNLRDYWAQPGTMVAAGLSPFSTMHLELGAFGLNYPSTTPGTLNPANPLAKAIELVVAFRLEPRQEPPGTTLPGVLTCQ